MSVIQPIIVIPALDPDEKLIDYVGELVSCGFEKILLVDDGSDIKKREIFNLLVNKYKCMLASHYVNMGKGRALKTAFNYCLTSLNMEQYSGIITVDSDGQHAVKDVKRIAAKLEECKDRCLVLGVRDFDKDNVPPKSRIGNKITRMVLKTLFGGNISDTQTGLRGITKNLLTDFLVLKGERFEYETTVLLECLKKDIIIDELIIDTIYENDNKGTHFRPIKDSAIIYGIILSNFIKYTGASLFAACIDISLFKMFMLFCANSTISVKYAVWGATIFARIISSLVNFFVNKNVVFEKKDNRKIDGSFIRYYMLASVQMICSAFFVYMLSEITELYVFSKIFVDTMLFGISYCIQQRWVFKNNYICKG